MTTFEAEPELPVTLRDPVYSIGGWVVGVGLFLMFGFVALSGPGPDPGLSDYVVTMVFGVVGALALFRATRMRMELDDDGATVVGYFRTRRIAWKDVARVEVDYRGLRLVATDGRVLTAVCLGKSNWSRWLHVETLADRATERVRWEVQRHNS